MPLCSFIDKGTDGALLKALNKQGLVQREITVNGKNGTFTRKQWVRATDADTQSASSSTQGVDLGDGSKAAIARALSSGATKDDVMAAAKAAGIKWKENAHPGINWMRASMAIQKSGITPAAQPLNTDAPQDTPADLVTQDDSQDDTPTYNVFDMVDWVGENPVDPNAKLDVDKPTEPDILKGITTDTISDYEEFQFGDIIKGASAVDLRNFRTLGMCAEDAESAEYLADLYGKYASNMTGKKATAEPTEEDKVRDKLSGVVNKQVIGVCKSSLSGIRRRVDGQYKVRNAILDPWVDPNTALDTQEIEGIKAYPKIRRVGSDGKLMRDAYDQVGAHMLGDRRVAALTEKDASHAMLHRVLDKFKQSPEYADLAEEYDSILTEFDQITGGSPAFLSCVQEVSFNGLWAARAVKNTEITLERYQEFLKEQGDSLSDEMKESIPATIERLEREKARHEESFKRDLDEHFDLMAERAKGRYDALYDQINRARLDPDINPALLRHLESELKQVTWERNDIEKTRKTITADKVVAAELKRSQLFDPRYKDLNANLYHYRRMGRELSYQYFVSKDFVSDYPVLSKDNLDKLENKDTTALTNLAMHAGLFKPSLAKDGNAIDALVAKYTERQQLIAAYGGVKATNTGDNYSENNEIRCKVSKADYATTKEITDKIAQDWDRGSHGSMRYEIKGVYEVSGLEVEQEFQDIKAKNQQYRHREGGKDCRSDMFYHGTGSVATSLILGHSGQFKIVKAKVGRMLGDGIYLADKSSKSAQYIGDEGYSRNGTEGSLMICEASTGYTYNGRAYNVSDRYDSVFAGRQHGLLNNEWCVRDPKAVIPRYLVHMELK